jgi:hypothetical protein
MLGSIDPARIVRGRDGRTRLMPRIQGIATLSWPLEACQSLDVWHRGNKCPETGSGERLVHRWIYKAAHACKHFKLTIDQAHDWILDRMTREPHSPREIPDTLAQVYSQTTNKRSSWKRDEIKYDPEALQAQAVKVDFDITPEWLAERSPAPVALAPEQFLRALYRENECVWIGTFKKARRGLIWRNDEHMMSLDHLRSGHEGVWFLSNPVHGRAEYTGSKTEHYPDGATWNSEANITSWRYLLLESDKAPADLWLKMLVQIRHPIVAIYTSGRESIHALIRINAPSKEVWDQFADTIKPCLIELGADPNSMTARRLTRLPGCIREETGQEQKLLYLNPQAEGNLPIINISLRKK